MKDPYRAAVDLRHPAEGRPNADDDATGSVSDLPAGRRLEKPSARPGLDSTLCKGISILECLSASDRSRGISELSNELGINKSNVHRILHSLISLGYVEQLGDRSYRATLKLWGVGTNVSEKVEVATCSHDVARQLAGTTSECVHLAVLHGMETIYIDKVDAASSPTLYFRKGGTAPLHCTATGKLLLAYNYSRLRLPISRRLERRTERTITTVDKLDAEVKTVLRNRFALNIEEMQNGINVVAAPVRDKSGSVVAAIGISGPNERLTVPRLMQHLDCVRQAAAEITHRLS